MKHFAFVYFEKEKSMSLDRTYTNTPSINPYRSLKQVPHFTPQNKRQNNWRKRKYYLTSSPLPAPFPSPFSSIPPPAPVFLFASCLNSSNSSSVGILSEGSGAKDDMVRSTRSAEERNEFVERRRRRTDVVA